jgi:hypothetical protein
LASAGSDFPAGAAQLPERAIEEFGVPLPRRVFVRASADSADGGIPARRRAVSSAVTVSAARSSRGAAQQAAATVAIFMG